MYMGIWEVSDKAQNYLVPKPEIKEAQLSFVSQVQEILKCNFEL